MADGFRKTRHALIKSYKVCRTRSKPPTGHPVVDEPVYAMRAGSEICWRHASPWRQLISPPIFGGLFTLDHSPELERGEPTVPRIYLKTSITLLGSVRNPEKPNHRSSNAEIL